MDTADFEVTDDQRINFLAELMNLSVLIEMGATLAPEKREYADERSMAIFKRYEFHRRTNDTSTAFRLAIDEAIAMTPNRSAV